MEMMSKRSMAGVKKILFMQNRAATKQQGRMRERGGGGGGVRSDSIDITSFL